MSLAPPSPLPGERPGAGLQHQVRDLHGRMDELTGQMQELRHLLQQLLEQQQQKLPSLYDMSDIAEDESTPPSTESF